MAGLERHFAYQWNRFRRYRLAAVFVIVSIVAGVVADRVVRLAAPAPWRAERALSAGDLVSAQTIYWEHLQEGAFEVPVLLDFLLLRETMAGLGAVVEGAEIGRATALDRVTVVASDRQVEALLGRPDLPEGAALAGAFWWDVLGGGPREALAAEVAAAAAAEPPVAWSNHVLGEAALRRGTLIEAAEFFEREGLRANGPEEDLERCLALLLAAGAHDELATRVGDPRFVDVVSPYLRSGLAFDQHRWGDWLRWLWPASYLRGSPASWVLALLSAGLWGWFCWRLGSRSWLLVVAVALGALSIYPTHVLIHLEEVIPALAETGDLVGDAIYFVLGVGLREEAAKLLCFLPLLLWLRRGTARGEGLVLGAAVGLGFAFVENVSYFEGGPLGTTLARFLTANFLHMSLTGIAAEAVTRAVRDRSDRGAAEAVNTFGLVVLLHGAYDWFLSTPQLAEVSFLAMTTFVIISRLFLRAAPVGRSRGGIPLVQVVVRSLAILCGASFVYGAAVAGPFAAASALAQGLLGVVLILVMFHRELE